MNCWVVVTALLVCVSCSGLCHEVVANRSDSRSALEEWLQVTMGMREPSSYDRLVIEREFQPGTTKIGLTAVGRSLRLGGRVYARGIGVNSPSVLRVTTTQPVVAFSADIGLDRNADGTDGSVRMYVKAGGRTLFSTGVITADGRVYPCRVDLGGVTEFTLEVDDGGDTVNCDQADWCDAQITYADGATAWLDDLARVSAWDARLPVSMALDGQPVDFTAWQRRAERRTLSDRAVRYTQVLSDTAAALEVRWEAMLYTDAPAVDWMATVTNRGQHGSPLISQLKGLDMLMRPVRRSTPSDGAITGLMFSDTAASGRDDTALPVLNRMHGSTGCVAFTWDDFQPVADPIRPGKKLIFGQTALRSSFDVSPFFDVEWQNGGAVFGLGWTGKWTAAVEGLEDGRIRVQAGQADLSVRLRPGESVRTPRVLMTLWNGDEASIGHNQFRRAMIGHVTPRDTRSGVPHLPPIAHMTSSATETNNTTEAIERGWLDSARGLGFECYWLDAWYLKGGFPAGIGNWTMPLENLWDPVRFPKGPKALADYAKSLGIPKFLMWFAPESAMPGTTLTREHPEYLLSTDGGASGSYNMGLAAARQAAIEYFDTVIKALGIDILRVDSGMDLGHVRSGDEGPDRVGIHEVRCVEGLYDFWDQLIKRNPGLLIDNCCGGGTRLDVESLARTIPLWRTDGAVWTTGWRERDMTAVQNQIITLSLNRYVPFSTHATMGTSAYYIRSGFNGGLAYLDDTRAPDFNRAELKQGIAECQRMRRYVLGDFYPLHHPGHAPDAWCAWQYHLPETHAGAIYVFRRPASPYTSLALRPRAIDLKASYRVTVFHEYRRLPARTLTGRQLQAYVARIDTAPGSLLLEYERL